MYNAPPRLVVLWETVVSLAGVLIGAAFAVGAELVEWVLTDKAYSPAPRSTRTSHRTRTRRLGRLFSGFHSPFCLKPLSHPTPKPAEVNVVVLTVACT